jgi:peptidyl-dipeptidase A
MKHILGWITIVLLVIVIIGCGKAEEEKMEWQEKADAFLNQYLKEFAGLELAQNTTYWKAANSGKQEDFDASARAELALKTLHSDSQRWARLEELLKHRERLNPLTARSLQVAALSFKKNQLPPETLTVLVNKASAIEQVFTAFRGKIGDKEYSDNELLQMMSRERDSATRLKIWQAMKQVGAAVAPKLVELARLRNEAAGKLGYPNYWDMQIQLDEHDPQELTAIFSELERLTDEPFRQMKAALDAELAKRFGIRPQEMMPWHYDNPFFQAAPPSAKIDLDEFYRDKKREEPVALAKRFFADMGLPVDDILKRSDLYERPGKNQHAFSSDIDRKGDVRILMNLSSTAEEMDTLLHELGHALYSAHHDHELPFNLANAAHGFTTEGVALLFGALAKTPTWLTTYAGVDENRVKEMKGAILEQRRREQLIFARWSLVMFYFEKTLYENPDQDLNKTWWDLVERFQFLKRPPDRDAPDWAAKIHFSISPVYYHNYQLGELLAAQLRASLVKLAKHDAPAPNLRYDQHPQFGPFFIEKIFKPGMTQAWPEFVKQASGEPLTAKYFARELK